MIATPLSIFLIGMAILLLIYCGIKYLVNALNHEKADESVMMYGFSAFFITYAISLFFWIFLVKFQQNLIYRDGVFYGNRENLTELFYIIDKIGLIMLLIGHSALFFTFERIVKKTKYCLSIMNLIFIILILIIPYDEKTYQVFNIVSVIFSFIDYLVFVIIMILLSKWSRLEFKAISIILINGVMLLGLGIIFTNPTVLSLNIFPLFLAPILYMVGCFICISPTILSPKTFSNALRYWYILGFVQLFFSIGLLLLFLVLVRSFEFIVMVLITAIITTFVNFNMIQNIKSQQSMDFTVAEKDKRKPPVKILEMFTRAQKVTEEEVSISKEKKICLVCKGKVEGYTFICTECSAFYCEKCANTLTTMENACWSCNAPFDKSKPSTPYKKEEEEEVKVLESKKDQKTNFNNSKKSNNK